MWDRVYLGTVLEAGVVHHLYEHRKAERAYWDTQCCMQWADRHNTNMALRPEVLTKPATCLTCVANQTWWAHG